MDSRTIGKLKAKWWSCFLHVLARTLYDLAVQLPLSIVRLILVLAREAAFFILAVLKLIHIRALSAAEPPVVLICTCAAQYYVLIPALTLLFSRSISRQTQLFLQLKDFFWQEHLSKLALPYGIKGSGMLTLHTILCSVHSAQHSLVTGGLKIIIISFSLLLQNNYIKTTLLLLSDWF